MVPDQAKMSFDVSSRISGWFTREAAYLFALLNRAQNELDIQGDLFEIGTHYGRSARFLVEMLSPGETLGCCDLFAGQDVNKSRSGFGDRQMFEQNLACHLERLRIYEQLSSTLTDDQVGRVRFFHVDGGHDTDEAVADLRLAERTLVDGGIVVLDDAFRADWPGVTEAFFEMMRNAGRFEPLIAGFNKLALTTPGWAARYRPLLENPWAYLPEERYDLKAVAVCGKPLLAFWAPPWKERDPIARRVVRKLRAVAKETTNVARNQAYHYSKRSA